MKHFTILSLILAVALCQTSSGAEKTSSAKAKQDGTRVQEKAVTARQMRGLMQGAKSPALTLLLRVETRLENGKQVAIATATVHTAGQTGPLAVVDALDVRVSEPVQSRKQGRGTNTTVASGSADAADGRFKTVVADAALSSPGIEDTGVTVKVPGDAR